MLKSSIENKNGKPILLIEGKSTSAMAYTTYFEERSRYEDFVNAGYRIFFINVSFTKSPINSFTGFTPFRKGVFEDPEKPDFSEFEDAVYKILDKCPEAIVFPRIYVSMPKWWLESHPDDVIPTQKGGYREALFSDTFRKDAGELLVKIVAHIRSADYSHRIGGWQICGGLTQEWFHHDSHGSLAPAAKEPYRRWVKENFGIDNAELPNSEDYICDGRTRQNIENAKRYSLFCNVEVAKTLERFAKIIKEETDHTQVVGAFYGYATQANGTPLFGTHGLRALLDSKYLDFFSAPNAYTENRKFGIDWADMIPVDSVKLHGKMPFIECDIRTYLTTNITEARPNDYPEGIYSGALWAGPPTTELSREALRKCFCHQLTKASAVWWFDMWGGWYDDTILMEALTDMKKIYDSDGIDANGALCPEVAFFADEQGFSKMLIDSPQIKAVGKTRTNMGNIGTPYDFLMVEDAPKTIENYKAAIFAMPISSDAGILAMRLCEEKGIPYITATEEHCVLSSDEIRGFLEQNGVHIYTKENDVVYVGNGYIALHSATKGRKALNLPTVCKIKAIFGTYIPEQTTSVVEFELEENATALFSVQAECSLN